MDPLTDEYNKLKMGPARNEAIEKAVTLSKAFAVDLGLKLTVLWLISLLQLLWSSMTMNHQYLGMYLAIY